MLRKALAALLFAAILAAPTSAASKKVRPRWPGFSPCTLSGNVKAFCGTYEVFENREARSGRKIPLKIVILPATGKDRAPDPVFFLEGGPGVGATLDAEELSKDPVRARRDIVLVDTRGTGGSNPLNCAIWRDGTRLDHIIPLDAVTACRDELRKRADLTLYTTAAAMDDLDEVRRHLGYGKVNLSGASYGTYAAQVFLARHPDAVRTVVLAAVVRPGEPSPLYHARNAQKALELLARDCAADPACHAAFPDLQQELSAVLDRLAKQPAKVRVVNPKTNKPVEVELTRSAAADSLRWALYSPEAASRVPLRIHLAAQGDYSDLAQAAVGLRTQLQDFLAGDSCFRSPAPRTCRASTRRRSPPPPPAPSTATTGCGNSSPPVASGRTRHCRPARETSSTRTSPSCSSPASATRLPRPPMPLSSPRASRTACWSRFPTVPTPAPGPVRSA